MTDTMTLTGLVATPPRHITTSEGRSITSFRLASNQRRFDRKTQVWVDAGTNWYTVSTYRQVALNVLGSVQKGDRILVTGRLRIRDWESGEKKGTNIELDADAIGHDLAWGKASFTRSMQSATVEEAGLGVFPAPEAAGEGPGNAEVAGAERVGLPVPF